MFIYLLCQPVANWAYLRIEGPVLAAACSHVSLVYAVRREREKISRLFFVYVCTPFDLPFICRIRGSRLQSYNIRRVPIPADFRCKNNRITFGDRDRLAIRLWRNYRAIGKASRCVLAVVYLLFLSSFNPLAIFRPGSLFLSFRIAARRLTASTPEMHRFIPHGRDHA